VNVLSVDPCPEAGEMAAFIDGALPPERVAQVTHHVTNCARCRIEIERAAEVEQEIGKPLVIAARPARRWLAVAAGLIIAVLAIQLYRGRNEPAQSDPIERLVMATPSSERTIEPRLCGGFPWAPLRPRRRSETTKKTPEELVASGAAGSVLREIGNDKSPQSLHAAGLAYLVAGDTKTAVTLIEASSREAGGNARVWSDLSAAIYMAAETDDVAALRRALDAADHAIRLNPRLAEAYFNRALILERVGTPRQTAAAWSEYLARDSVTGWSAEARSRLGSASRQRE
jgi:tetratricopeptide (TPR) repeat protein